MSAPTKHNRLDNIEVQLTPKQWAIRLVDEIRKHPSESHFDRAVARGTTREAPFINPTYNLAEQAERCYPGNKPPSVNVRIQLERKLRTEFRALKLLIWKANGNISRNAEINGLKAALKLLTLQILIKQDAFGRTATKAATFIEEYKTSDDEERERYVILNELADYADMSLAERSSHGLPQTASRTQFSSLIECWVQEFIRLIVDVFAQKGAVHAVQHEQFDGQPMLFREVEAALDETIKTMEDTVLIFNEYLKATPSLSRAEWDQGNGDGIAFAIPDSGEGYRTIDIQAVQRLTTDWAVAIADRWVEEAQDTAFAVNLEETGEHESYMWEQFRKEDAAKP